MQQTGTIGDTENSMFVQKLDVTTPLKSVTLAAVIDLVAQSLVEFIEAQGAAGFCQTAAKELGKP